MDETTLAAHLSRVESDGYTLIEGAIEPDLVDELLEALDRLVVESELRGAPFDPEDTIDRDPRLLEDTIPRV